MLAEEIKLVSEKLNLARS